jgi:hypothetical protein
MSYLFCPSLIIIIRGQNSFNLSHTFSEFDESRHSLGLNTICMYYAWTTSYNSNLLLQGFSLSFEERKQRVMQCPMGCLYNYHIVLENGVKSSTLWIIAHRLCKCYLSWLQIIDEYKQVMKNCRSLWFWF